MDAASRWLRPRCGKSPHKVEAISERLRAELATQIDDLGHATASMADAAVGGRMVDLALNVIEIIDRNLYERTCDVRWWATDSAIVDCAANANDENCAYASKRLGVILNAYTVYLDLWLCDLDGRVIANGRPERYNVKGLDVSREPWFARAAALTSGDDYTVADISLCGPLNNAQVATYAASVRAGGESQGPAARRAGGSLRLGAASPHHRQGRENRRRRVGEDHGHDRRRQTQDHRVERRQSQPERFTFA